MRHWCGRIRLTIGGAAAAWSAVSACAALAGPTTPAAIRIESPATQRLSTLAVGESALVAGWPIDGSQRADLVFTRIDIWDPEARILTVGPGGTVTEYPRPARRHFIGRASGDGFAVMLAVGPDGHPVRMITFGAAEPVEFRRSGRSAAGEHVLEFAPVVAGSAEGEAGPSWTCGQEELPTEFPEVGSALPIAHALSLASLHTATVAVDTDNEFMSLKFGNNTTNAAAYIADLFAAINVMYERDLNVRLLVGTTYLRVSADPWEQTTSGSATSAQLNEFSNYWAANYGGVTRALAAMLSGKQPSNNSASGIAWLNGLCSTNIGYSFSQVFKIDYLSGDAKIVGHEIGHNFGSPHTHCYSPPIDTCYNGEGGCYSGATSCPAPATVNGVPNIKGTVMSYCHMLGGCSASMVFHPTVEAYLDGKMAPKIGVCILPLAVNYTLTVSRNGTGTGTVTSSPTGINCGSDCSESYSSGTVVTLTAAPAVGSTFAGWSGACSGTGTCVATMSAARSVTATFNALPSYALSVSKSGAGSGTVTSSPAGIDCGDDCVESYAGGTVVTLTAAPAALAAFTGWSGACSGAGSCQVTMDGATAVTATFADVSACTTTVSDQTVVAAVTIENCYGILAGPSLVVGSPGHLSLRAAVQVILRNGTSISSGARLTVALDPSLAGT